MINLLKSGYVMEVKHPTNPNYAPTVFYYRNRKIWFSNPEAGTGEHPVFKTNKALMNHVRNMLNQGFAVQLSNPQ